MENAERASQDAMASPACAGEEEAVRWLKPRGRNGLRRRRARRPAGKLTRLGATLGVGAVLTVSSAQSAVGPASLNHAADLVGAAAIIDATTKAAREAQDIAPLDASELVTVALAPAPEIDVRFDDFVEAPAVPAANHSNVVASIEFPIVSRSEAQGARPAERGDDILSFDGVKIRRSLVETILRAADVTGVDPTYMMALADKESSFLTDNKASTSSAEGLFQFVEKTWLEMIRDFGAKYGMEFAAASVETVDGQPAVESDSIKEWVLGLRRNPYLSALMAAEMLKRDKAKIERRLGRALNRSELYLMHFLGAQSAGKLLELVSGKPKQSAPRVFPQAARANKSLFFARDKRKTRHLTVAEVYNKIDRMIDTRLDRYEGVSAFAPIEAASFGSPF